MEISAYPHSFLTFDEIHAHIGPYTHRMQAVQHSIRRFEFDAWLLQRSGAAVHRHDVRSIERRDGQYVVDDRFSAPYIVGAGGTRCPVYRSFFREANPRAQALQAVTLEQEFPYEWQDGTCHLWFFEGGLPGYSWYVPKGNGWLNVGIGGMKTQLGRRDEHIRSHWERLTGRLGKDKVRGHRFEPKGYSYYLRGDIRVAERDGAYITGDALGLATRDLCEGIGPAIRTGIDAARCIESGSRYDPRPVEACSTTGIARRLLEYMFVRRSEKAV
jgi:flavin-dependent dehydrogenase